MSTEPDQSFLTRHGNLLISSFQRQTGQMLPGSGAANNINSEQLYHAPYAVVSHDTRAVPVFNYGNRTALTLFELSWNQFTQLPSYKSAEPSSRDERERLLLEVSRNGFIDDYRGIRISASGKRFRIEAAVVWDVIDSRNVHVGQAALLKRWTFLEREESV